MNSVRAAALIAVLLLLSSSLLCLEYPKNPTKAMLLSALVPGGGQIYNEAYLKSLFVIGLQGYLVSTALHHNAKAGDYQELMDNAGSWDANYLYYKARRDEYRDNLTSDYWWIGTVLVLSVADAFVEAHLHNYQAEKQKIKLKFTDKLLLEFEF